MIGHLRGTVIRAGTERLLLDVGGVGYELHASLATLSEVEPAARSGEVSLHVYTHLWSDGIALYGFWTELEKLLFERLITVSGIGPRLARVILSGMPPPALIATLAAGDAARLTTIPGIGKKSAERMVVELKDKVQELAAGLPGPAAAGPAEGEEELVSALVNLGYKRPKAERAVREALSDLPDGAFHEVLRASLKLLSAMG
jgi:Holliday junction DNA helicase RuvA